MCVTPVFHLEQFDKHFAELWQDRLVAYTGDEPINCRSSETNVFILAVMLLYVVVPFLGRHPGQIRLEINVHHMRKRHLQYFRYEGWIAFCRRRHALGQQ